MKDLNYYVECFSSLHTMKKCGKPAPHKALLLLSVIDLVERGSLNRMAEAWKPFLNLIRNNVYENAPQSCVD